MFLGPKTILNYRGQLLNFIITSGQRTTVRSLNTGAYLVGVPEGGRDALRGRVESHALLEPNQRAISGLSNLNDPS